MEPFNHNATFTCTDPPHPEWKPAENQPIPAPFSSTREAVYTAAELKREMYSLLISAVVPRPIAFVSTIGSDPGAPANLAPFSYYTIICHDPPTLMLSINYSRGKPKDTLINIQETGQFVINSFNEHFVESANHCSAPVPYTVEENALSGLTLIPSNFIKPPRCKEALLSFECTLSHSHNVENDAGDIVTCVVFGRVVGITVKNEVMDVESKVVDLALFKPVSRLGGNFYGRTVSGYEIKRPSA